MGPASPTTYQINAYKISLRRLMGIVFGLPTQSIACTAAVEPGAVAPGTRGYFGTRVLQIVSCGACPDGALPALVDSGVAPFHAMLARRL